MVLNEIKNKSLFLKLNDYINAKKLIIHTSDTKETAEILKLKIQAKGNLSVQDCSVWKLAKDKSALLLTGDKRLRIKAEKDGVKVSGIIFVFDELFKNKIITKKLCISKLNELMLRNTRLPQKICQDKMSEWERL